MPVSQIRIRPFQPGDAEAFRKLNEAWINMYFGMEEPDRMVLENPETHIIRPGGAVFLAFMEDEPVGTCALIPIRPGVFEVAKMSVREDCRGKGIGRQILEYAIERAKELGATVLHLETNSKLANAIHLYESVGFRHIPPEEIEPSPYVRANVFMDMRL